MSGHATQRAASVNLTHLVTRVYLALRVRREVQMLSQQPAVLLLLSPPPTLSLFFYLTYTQQLSQQPLLSYCVLKDLELPLFNLSHFKCVINLHILMKYSTYDSD